MLYFYGLGMNRPDARWAKLVLPAKAGAAAEGKGAVHFNQYIKYEFRKSQGATGITKRYLKFP